MSEFVHGDNLTKKENDSDTTAEQLRMYSAILMLAVVGHLLACCLSRVLNASF